MMWNAQKGYPARPQAQESPQAYPLGYVEDAFKTRTQLVIVFNGLPRYSRRACLDLAHTIPVCSFEVNPSFS